MARFLAVFFSFLVTSLGTVAASAKEFALGTVGEHRVTAELPDGWSLGSPQGSIPSAATAQLTYGAAPDAVLLVTVLQPTPGSPLSHANAQTILELVTDSAARASAQSVEGNLKVEPFESGAVQGAYFSATDKAPPLGEFKFMSQGVASFGDLSVTFTALSHVDAAGSRDAMLRVVGSLRSTSSE